MAGTGIKKRRPYKDGQVTVILEPGDELPRGTYRHGWKLDPGSLGPGRMYLIITPDDGPSEPPAQKQRRVGSRGGTTKYRKEP